MLTYLYKYFPGIRSRVKRRDLIISVNTGEGASDPTIIYFLDPNLYPLCWKQYRTCEHVENITDFEINFMNNSILIIGGKSVNGRSMASVLSLDVRYIHNIWRADTDMIPSRYGCAAAVDQNRFVISGGCQSMKLDENFEDFGELLLCEEAQITKKIEPDQYLKHLSDYGPLLKTDILKTERVLRCVEFLRDNKNWDWLPPLPFRLMNHAVIIHQGSVYVSGGQQSPDGPALHSTLKFDPNYRNWVGKSDMLIARVGHKLISNYLSILAVGGEWLVSEQWCPVYVIEQYDMVRDDWSILTCIANPRSHLGSALYCGKLFIVSGYERKTSEFVKDTDIFDLYTNKWYKGPTYPSEHKPKCMVIMEETYVD